MQNGGREFNAEAQRMQRTQRGSEKADLARRSSGGMASSGSGVEKLRSNSFAEEAAPTGLRFFCERFYKEVAPTELRISGIESVYMRVAHPGSNP